MPENLDKPEGFEDVTEFLREHQPPLTEKEVMERVQPPPYGDNGISRGLFQKPPLPKFDYSKFMPLTLAALIKECGEDSEAWFPGIIHDLMYSAGCIAGEAGELVNEVKKVRRGTHELDAQKAKIEEESIDVLIFLACLWYELETNVTEVYRAKRRLNAGRFGSPDPAGE